MRLMTFPGEVNGFKASFPFGFGVAVAGFSDIIYEHYHTNIPDWDYLEAGDPVTERDKLMDRSPINHVDKISGPLLLIHGDHDDRVDIGGSQMLYDALKERVPDIRIEDLPIPFAAVASDLFTGEPVVFREGPLFTAIRASISIPSMFRPVKWHGHTLVDGGLVNTFPLGLVQRREDDILVGFTSAPFAHTAEQIE